MTENDLLILVVEKCKTLGLDWFHDYNPKGNPPGLPDLIIFGRRILWRELKNDHATLRGKQGALGWRIKAGGQNWAVWRPADWRSGLIEHELEQIK